MLKKGFKDLKVWQKSMDFTIAIYAETKKFPREEVYGLTSQLRRASISVASNIAEGATRSSTRDFIRLIEIAIGSIAEVETQLTISERLGYLKENESSDLINKSDEIIKMLYGLKDSLNSKLIANRSQLTTVTE